jgi:hypothetical protein
MMKLTAGKFLDVFVFLFLVVFFTSVLSVLLAGTVHLCHRLMPEPEVPTENFGAYELQTTSGFDWPVFLSALEAAEAPKTEKQARRAIAREGAHGILQIRQPCIDDVNNKYGTRVSLDDVQHSRGISRWVCVHYLKMYNATDSYETAARVWNGGPCGPYKKSTRAHWKRVKSFLPIPNERPGI